MAIPLVQGQVLVDGQFTSAKAQQVVLAIKEYDEFINVDWIPPAARSDENAAAFRISHCPPGQEPYVLFYVRDEDFDERVLRRIIVNDKRAGGGASLSDFEAWEATQRLMQRQRELDELEAIEDIVKHALATHKSRYKINDTLVIDDSIPHNAAHLDENKQIITGAPPVDLSRYLP